VKPWLTDIPDQLALAKILAGASFSCGERIGLIVSDNAVEYMLVAYVEAHKRLVGKTITKSDWENKKRRFESLLDYVISQCSGILQYHDDLLHFHEIRNSLYHTGKPMSVRKEKVEEHVELARNVFTELFGIALTPADIEVNVSQIHSALVRGTRSISAAVSFEKRNGLVRFSTDAELNNPDAICLALYGFGMEMLRAPTFDELRQSMEASGVSLTKPILSSRLYDLRRKGYVRNGDRSLTAAGRKYVQRNFLLPA